MDEKESASFRSLYATWPTGRLARATTVEKGDFRPEAVELMLEELGKRGIVGAAVSDLAASMPPPIEGVMPVRDMWLLPARLNRRQYLIRTFVVFLSSGCLLYGLTQIDAPTECLTVVCIAAFVYIAIGLVLPRSKDAGLPSWTPIACGYITFAVLFFLPSKQK